MKELQTILGTDIPTDTRGILYLCEFTYHPLKIVVKHELLFQQAYVALDSYANIPNPESQLVTGKTFDELITKLHKLHKDMEQVEWLEQLAETL